MNDDGSLRADRATITWWTQARSSAFGETTKLAASDAHYVSATVDGAVVRVVVVGTPLGNVDEMVRLALALEAASQ